MQPIQVFCSYARHSRQDKIFLHDFENHLANLIYQGQIELWHDQKLAPGLDVERETLTRLQHADIILLFVSSDYIADRYCYNVEVMQAIEMQGADIAYVRVIRTRHVDLEGAPFSWCQSLPTDETFIHDWSHRHEAYLDIVQDFKDVVREARESRPLRETNRAMFSARHNNTLVKTGMPPSVAFRVNRQTDDLKIKRRTEDLKRTRQTEELKQRRRSTTKVKTQRQVYANQAEVPAYTPTPRMNSFRRRKRSGRRAIQNSAKLSSTDIAKWRKLSKDELKKVTKGRRGIFLMLLLIADVGLIPIAILGWSGSVVLAGLACLISLPVFAYGMVNIYNQATIPLALLYAGTWGIILHHYVSWPLLSIIGIFTLLACIHYFLFQRHVP